LVLIPHHFPVLGVLLDIPRQIQSLCRSLDSRYSLRWNFVPHKQVGGVTYHSAWFVGRYPGTIKKQQFLVHSLGAIIDYSVFLSSMAPDPQALPLDSFIPVNNPGIKICLPNRFSSHSLSSRFLSCKELFGAWDIPDWVTRPHTHRQALQWIEQILPLKTLLVVSHAVCTLLPIAKVPISGSALPKILPIEPEPRDFYLPHLRRWLSPVWIEARAITEKAAKSDDAPIPTDLWDLRIMTCLNCLSFLFSVKYKLRTKTT